LLTFFQKNRIFSKFWGVIWSPEVLLRDNAQVELAHSKIPLVIEMIQKICVHLRLSASKKQSVRWLVIFLTFARGQIKNSRNSPFRGTLAPHASAGVRVKIFLTLQKPGSIHPFLLSFRIHPF
jgi:hypothetical protein